ncbi:hypothetical protein DPMN_184949 [Dreissena polymorpha]|uniref:Uncharacterized protein n=1 Tax=Dreissena polymorpha TaxID=45954 RepID=A0A9D4DLU4_DREPO|nr:hypothetical protein DPMN_184949 [Dreissena polymorpha]
MGRVREPDGLRVVNFTKDAVIAQSSCVVDFLRGENVPLTADMSCCHRLSRYKMLNNLDEYLY